MSRGALSIDPARRAREPFTRSAEDLPKPASASRRHPSKTRDSKRMHPNDKAALMIPGSHPEAHEFARARVRKNTPDVLVSPATAVILSREDGEGPVSQK